MVDTSMAAHTIFLGSKTRLTKGVMVACDLFVLAVANCVNTLIFSIGPYAVDRAVSANALIVSALTILYVYGRFSSNDEKIDFKKFVITVPFLSASSVIIGCLVQSLIEETIYRGGISRFLSWPFIVSWMVSAWATIWSVRVFTWFALRRTQTKALKRVAIVGAGPLGTQLSKVIRERFSDQMKVIGIFDDRATRIPLTVGDSSVRPIAELSTIAKSHQIDKALVALPLIAEERILDILINLKSLPIDVALVPDGMGIRLLNQNTVTSRVNLDQFLLQVNRRPMTTEDILLKRAFDICVGSLLLLFLAPLMIGVALAIALTSPGPVFFRQPRAGLCDDLIKVFKFRTMYVDQSDILAQRQTSRDDPRVTPIGRYLRRTSIDELPQLFNVLRGEMSLVGPRPHATGMQINGRSCHELLREYAQRHRVRPGITGWAQVCGYRGAIDDPGYLSERVKHDIYYIDNWSLWFDLKIIAMTIPEILFSRTAF